MNMFQKNVNNGSLFIFVITFSLLAGLVALPQSSMAHKGHAGPQVVFLKKEEALKQMLPAGAKIVQRKEKLEKGNAEKVKRELGIILNDGVYTYYVARDRSSGATIGAAMVTEVEYKHGDISLAIGVNSKGDVTKAAILSVNEKYVPDMKASVGTGFLQQIEGVSIKKLVSMANEASGFAMVTELIFTQLRDMAALLATFLTPSP